MLRRYGCQSRTYYHHNQFLVCCVITAIMTSRRKLLAFERSFNSMLSFFFLLLRVFSLIHSMSESGSQGRYTADHAATENKKYAPKMVFHYYLILSCSTSFVIVSQTESLCSAIDHILLRNWIQKIQKI